MIKEITINYPDFWLELNQKFKSGINILEKENWYWKTSIINTIQSIYTGKFVWLRTLPKGHAEVITDNNKYILSKWNWLGVSHEANDLYNYIIPWAIWDRLDTSNKRRQVIVDLLWLDYNTFMKKECDKVKDKFPFLEWNENLESNLNKKLKEDTMKSEILSEDIMRYQAEVRDVPMEDFSDIDKFYKDKKLIEEKVREYNKWIIDRQTKYNTLLRERDNLNSSINNNRNEIERLTNANLELDKQLQWLRDTYTSSEKEATCSSCGSKLQWDNLKKLLDWIVQTANKCKEQKVSNENNIKELIKKKELTIQSLDKVNKQIDSFDINFTVLSYDNILDNAKKFWIDFKWISENRLQEVESYKEEIAKIERIKQELKRKEEEVKSINTITLSNNIDMLKDIKRMFTDKLQEATKDLPVDIELFKLQKNWEIKETFSVNFKWIEYSNLSTWNKSIVNIMLAILFIDKLWLDFILIDEASNISKNNIDYIKELSNKYQVILARATWWTMKDFK